MKRAKGKTRMRTPRYDWVRGRGRRRSASPTVRQPEDSSFAAHGFDCTAIVESVDEIMVIYNGPGSDEILTRSCVGWSLPYAANWERNFEQRVNETN